VFSVHTDNGGNSLVRKQAACALCHVQGRSAVTMIPARTECPSGWTTEYVGYLVSAYTVDHTPSSHGRTSYVCLDEAPERALNNDRRDPTKSGLLYPTEVLCGSLPCSIYPNGRELACVVCSR